MRFISYLKWKWGYVHYVNPENIGFVNCSFQKIHRAVLTNCFIRKLAQKGFISFNDQLIAFLLKTVNTTNNDNAGEFSYQVGLRGKWPIKKGEKEIPDLMKWKSEPLKSRTFDEPWYCPGNWLISKELRNL